MTEYEEFADALFDQLDVETNEEKVIADLMSKIKDETELNTQFEKLEDISSELFEIMKEKAEEFLHISVSDNLKIEYPKLNDFKKLKGKKIFATINSKQFVEELFDAVIEEDRAGVAKLVQNEPIKFFVYSTYAKSYLSKISTTYGDYMDSVVYLNRFILESYPQIILYKIGKPFERNLEGVKSGYLGALKRTILEETVHSMQTSLHESNKQAVISVNSINEELAEIILNLKDETVSKLSDYLQLQAVPKEFPTAQRANLFFMLNPDNFVTNILGPQVMTYSHIEIDPKIKDLLPQLEETYQKWLSPIQKHHARFTTSEGMAEFAVENILKNDIDFKKYITMFAGMDESAYWIKKNIGKNFIQVVYEKFSNNTFNHVLENVPSTQEIEKPELYINRLAHLL
ncbi:MAG: hypothetical protein R1F52_05915 [Candidatus Nitrosoabyssus spongiisocia]|nr:MAG: hypothetical protein R1F52_05915 [Nitrosopumilaceae archaeon AB1(1)]